MKENLLAYRNLDLILVEENEREGFFLFSFFFFLFYSSRFNSVLFEAFVEQKTSRALRSVA